MNPLEALRNLIAPPATNTPGTVVGAQGSLTMVRTANGIKLVDAKSASFGSVINLDSKGSVVSVQDSDNVIPSFRV